MVELPISQPKGPKQKYSVSLFQDGRVVPIKGNVVTRGKDVQGRPEGRIICNPPLSEIQKVCQISVERPSILSVRIIIYLGDMLLLASSLEDLLMAIDTLIFILQHLDFLINIKNSYIEPTSTLEFLGVIVDSGEMTLNLPKEKLLKVQNHCQEILEKGKVTVRKLSKLIGRLSSTAIAILPAPLHYRHLQHQQIQKLICHNSFEEKVEISVEARKELLWWKENLTLCNGRSLISSPPQIIISSDASLQGWGASCHRLTTGGP